MQCTHRRVHIIIIIIIIIICEDVYIYTIYLFQCIFLNDSIQKL